MRNIHKDTRMAIKQKVTINPQSNDEKCFKHAIILGLYHEKIAKNPHRNQTVP